MKYVVDLPFIKASESSLFYTNRMQEKYESGFCLILSRALEMAEEATWAAGEKSVCQSKS